MKRLLFALAFVAQVLSPIAGRAEHPNVLLMMVDDLRDHLGCYGNRVVKTPHIDRLADRSVLFERAYVQYPVCNPSRSSMLSGLRCDQTGVTDNTTMLRTKLPDVVTFPQLLKDNGYRSEAYGKIFHLGGGKNPELRSKWMDLPSSWHVAQAFEPTDIGRHKLAGRDLTAGELKWCHWGMMAGGDEDQPDGQIAAAVIKAMRKADERPWIIGAGFMKPHDPFLAPKNYFDLYPSELLTLYRDPDELTPAPEQAVGFGAFGKAFNKFTDRERLEFQRAYYACTSFMDAQVGKVLDELDRLDLWDDTVVIFMSDHGYHLGERNWWNKNTLFDRSCRAPMMIAAPGIQPGRASGLVEFVDVYPTITDFCGVNSATLLTGMSLRPLLDNPAKPGKSAALTIVTRGPQLRGDSIRTERWRFTQWSDGQRELYDHENDPEETKNVAEDPRNAELIEQLRKQLTARSTG